MIESELNLPIPDEILEAEKILKENNNKMLVSDLARLLNISYVSLINLIKRLSKSIKITRDIYTKQLLLELTDVQ